MFEDVVCCSHTSVGASEDQDDLGVGAHFDAFRACRPRPN